jgi:hypothetical protein
VAEALKCLYNVNDFTLNFENYVLMVVVVVVVVVSRAIGLYISLSLKTQVIRAP